MWDKRDDMIVHERDPYNAEPPPHALGDSSITSVDTFYSRNHGTVPVLDAARWRLRVDGLVGTALSLSLADLQNEFRHVSLVATLQCAGNRRIGLLAVRDIPGEAPWGPAATSTAEWTGVRLADVLDRAGIGSAARYVAFEAPDISGDAVPVQPYGSSIPLAKAMSEEVLLAWDMNEAPLPAVHGGPVRVVVPGYIGARSVKWVQHISVQQEPSQNYYQAVAYRLLPADSDLAAPDRDTGFALGPVALNSAILRPEHGAHVSSGTVEVSGYAYTGDKGGVARVDVSIDEGARWVQTHLDPAAGDWSWRIWRVVLELPPGRQQVTVRAWDTAGASQPESAADLWNPKGYVNNSWDSIELIVAPA